MTKEDFSNQIVARRLELIKKVLESKGVEYGASKSAFHTFDESTGISLHSKNASTAWEMCVKHLTSIKNIISDFEYCGQLPSESILEEKIGDAINYFILIEGMLKEHIKAAQKIEPVQEKLKWTMTTSE